MSDSEATQPITRDVETDVNVASYISSTVIESEIIGLESSEAPLSIKENSETVTVATISVKEPSEQIADTTVIKESSEEATTPTTINKESPEKVTTENKESSEDSEDTTVKESFEDNIADTTVTTDTNSNVTDKTKSEESQESTRSIETSDKKSDFSKLFPLGPDPTEDIALAGHISELHLKTQLHIIEGKTATLPGKQIRCGGGLGRIHRREKEKRGEKVVDETPQCGLNSEGTDNNITDVNIKVSSESSSDNKDVNTSQTANANDSNETLTATGESAQTSTDNAAIKSSESNSNVDNSTEPKALTTDEVTVGSKDSKDKESLGAGDGQPITLSEISARKLLHCIKCKDTDDLLTKVSKTVSYLLRRGTKGEKYTDLPFDSENRVRVKDLLPICQNVCRLSDLDYDELLDLLEDSNDKKKRYHICPNVESSQSDASDSNDMMIKAIHRVDIVPGMKVTGVKDTRYNQGQNNNNNNNNNSSQSELHADDQGGHGHGGNGNSSNYHHHGNQHYQNHSSNYNNNHGNGNTNYHQNTNSYNGPKLYQVLHSEHFDKVIVRCGISLDSAKVGVLERDEIVELATQNNNLNVVELDEGIIRIMIQRRKEDVEKHGKEQVTGWVTQDASAAEGPIFLKEIRYSSGGKDYNNNSNTGPGNLNSDYRKFSKGNKSDGSAGGGSQQGYYNNSYGKDNYHGGNYYHGKDNYSYGKSDKNHSKDNHSNSYYGKDHHHSNNYGSSSSSKDHHHHTYHNGKEYNYNQGQYKGNSNPGPNKGYNKDHKSRGNKDGHDNNMNHHYKGHGNGKNYNNNYGTKDSQNHHSSKDNQYYNQNNFHKGNKNGHNSNIESNSESKKDVNDTNANGTTSRSPSKHHHASRSPRGNRGDKNYSSSRSPRGDRRETVDRKKENNYTSRSPRGNNNSRSPRGKADHDAGSRSPRGPRGPRGGENNNNKANSKAASRSPQKVNTNSKQVGEQIQNQIQEESNEKK